MPQVTPVDPRQVLALMVEHAGSQRAAAKLLGVSQAYVNDLLFGRRGFSARMLAKMGLRRAVVSTKQHPPGAQP